MVDDARGIPAGVWRRAMVSRDPHEPHRSSTPLELFFDLCFVVAVARLSERFHHALSEGHVGSGVLAYAMVFFAIWWAWLNVTWFASAFDTDDGPYRLVTLVQMTGALILAAGVPDAFDERNFAIVTFGYAVLRVGLVVQWLRAAGAEEALRATALRFAAGVTVCQVGWIALLALPDEWYLGGWPPLAVAEMAVPVWAESAGSTPWHPEHIAERYGLFTIIVLGESILAASVAIQSVLDADEATAGLATVIAGGLLTVFSMWWLYFAKPAGRFLVSNRIGFLWGYGHLVVFSSAAAVGAGIAVNVDRVTGHSALSDAGAGATVTVPVALYLLMIWFLQIRPHRLDVSHSATFIIGAALVLVATFSGTPVLTTGLICAAVLAVAFITASRRYQREGRGVPIRTAEGRPRTRP